MTDWGAGGVRMLVGDCRERLRELPDASVDAVVTDPPYGLSREPDIAEVLRHWLAGDDYQHHSAGFMGRSWDSFVPGPSVWREVYRVLKPGAHLLAFAGTRTMDLMSIAIRMAGFENRDTISAEGVLRWVYGSGFPKSLDVGRAIDSEVCERPGRHYWREDSLPKGEKARPDDHVCAFSSEGDGHRGKGTAFKPAWEPILVFRKPLAAPNVASNVLEHDTGALNIDGCRIESVPPSRPQPDFSAPRRAGALDKVAVKTHDLPTYRNGEMSSAAGRWPANLVLSHAEGCRPAGTRRVRSNAQAENHRTGMYDREVYGGGLNQRRSSGYAGLDGLETVEAWECEPGCPVAELDRQSGVGASPVGPVRQGGQVSVGGLMNRGTPRDSFGIGYGDRGGASRFFYVAKASASERSVGLPSGQRNRHETVKPLELVRWLCRLVTPPGGTILDPFAGSGTTGCAAVLEGFGFVGIEQDEDSVRAAVARIRYWGRRGQQVALELVEEREPEPTVDEPACTGCGAPGPGLSRYVTGLYCLACCTAALTSEAR